MTKQIFIISESCDGCYYYRAEVFMRYSKEFSVKSNVDYSRCIVKSPYDCMDELFDSDIVVFLRPTQINAFPLLTILRSLGKLIVFSSDDSFKSIDSKNPAHTLKKNLHINEGFLRNSDFAITTTDNLAKEYVGDNQNTLVVPNYIDSQDFLHTKKRDRGRLRVGLIGSVHTAENSEKFLDILTKIHQNKRVELVFFGNDDFGMVNNLKKTFLTRVEFVGNVPVTEYSKKLASLDLDIALIPRKDNAFNRSKSNCKYLEVSLAGIATIAQGFKDGKSPYQADIKNGVNGYIAINDDEWLSHFSELTNDEKRDAVVKKAKEYVLANYDVNTKIANWDNALLEGYKRFKNSKKVETELTKAGLYDLFHDKNRDLIIKNYKKEVKFLNRELDRIRGRLYYRLLSRLFDFFRHIKGK